MTAGIAAPEVFVRTVVEVEDLEVAELAARRGKQFLDPGNVIIHAASDIQQHELLYCVMTLGHHADIEQPGIACRAGDRVIKIEFGFSAFACKAPQPAQRNLEVARAEFLLVVVIAELAPFPDLDRRAIAGRGAAASNSRGVVATMPEGRAAARAAPLAAAPVPALLLAEALAEHRHALVPAVLFERGLLFGRELLLESLDRPLEGNLLALRIQGGDLSVVRGKGPIVAVEERFVLHQRH